MNNEQIFDFISTVDLVKALIKRDGVFCASTNEDGFNGVFIAISGWGDNTGVVEICANNNSEKLTV